MQNVVLFMTRLICCQLCDIGVLYLVNCLMIDMLLSTRFNVYILTACLVKVSEQLSIYEFD